MGLILMIIFRMYFKNECFDKKCDLIGLHSIIGVN